MNAPVTDFCCQLRDGLARRIGRERFNVWFKTATRFARVGGVVQVEAANPFVCNWIEKHYARIIADVARQLAGECVEIVFRVAADLATELRRAPTRPTDDPAADADDGAAAEPPPPRSGDARRAASFRGRFESFVTGPCNVLAYQAAMAVAQAHASAPACLFIHGGSGLGKTHLLEGIVNALSAGNGAHRPRRWLHATGEEFTNSYIRAVMERRLEHFRRRYRDVDVLVIDDIHFLANKRATQDEFLHTFNSIDTAGKHIVLASDAVPRLIANMSQALVSRFSGGMVVQIERPDLPTRVGILQRRLDDAIATGRATTRVPPAVLECIAEEVQTNVRELEGALLRVLAVAVVTKSPVTPSLVRSVLQDHKDRARQRASADQIVAQVARYFGLKPEELSGPRRSRTIALARSVCMHLIREQTCMSYPEVARAIGVKNHVTALQACRRVARWIAEGSTVGWTSSDGPQARPIAAVLADLRRPS